MFLKVNRFLSEAICDNFSLLFFFAFFSPSLQELFATLNSMDTDSLETVKVIPVLPLVSEKPNTEQKEFTKTIWNQLPTLKSRRDKCKRSLQVLRKHKKNSKCLYSSQDRPRPLKMFDKELEAVLDQISRRAQAEITLMIKQQVKDLTADIEAILAQQQSLHDLTLVIPCMYGGL